ncbi:MAG: TetR/AcrR family transcriptional regulator [Xanthomonadaceae bacterium]|nr:TetR/AcrR family transcriptional regulator [Xanthomonadaceae bacterium]
MVAQPSPTVPSTALSGTGAKPKPVGPGRPKDLGKRSAILEAAKHLFPTHGFDGVSMDQIAAEAGVSKLTVYSHFGDKESLFTAAISVKCEEQMPAALFLDRLQGGLREQLTAIAGAFFALVTSEEAIALHRMMMMPGTGDSKARELFWQAGPQRVTEEFAEFLRARAAMGELVDLDDPHRAASQFFCLLKGEPHMQLMCGMCECLPAATEVQRHLDATVDLFMRAYGRRESASPDTAGAAPTARSGGE